MKKVNLILLICICSLFFVSCQKELTMDSSLGLGGTTSSLKGNWKFIGMNAKTESIVELTDGIDVLKTITRSEYNTKQNTGTVVIDDSKMTSTNFGYEIDTLATGLLYENNVLIDSVVVPFSFIVPPMNSVSPYTKVTADSIYATGGQFATISGSSPNAKPTGAKLQFQGDKLHMTINFSTSDVQIDAGIKQTTKQTAKIVMTYQRQ